MTNNIICYDSYNNPLEHFYQWDMNQRIKIVGIREAQETRAHFTNDNVSTAFTVIPTVLGDTMIVDVPNILLQEGIPIRLYVYQSTPAIEGKAATGGARTKYEILLPVVPRSKPDDYIYTNNVEFLTFQKIVDNAEEATLLAQKASEDIQRKLDAGEFNGEDAYDLAVKKGFTGTKDEWLKFVEANSREAQAAAEAAQRSADSAKGFTDAAAGSATQAAASAENAKSEADRARQTVDGFSLPPASKTQLGGIKVGSGLSTTAEGVLSVTEGKWELIEEITLAEDSTVKRTQEPNGTPYKFSETIVAIATSDRGIISSGGINYRLTAPPWFIGGPYFIASNTKQWFWNTIEKSRNLFKQITVNRNESPSNSSTLQNLTQNYTSLFVEAKPIKEIEITAQLSAGSKISIWAVRA